MKMLLLKHTCPWWTNALKRLKQPAAITYNVACIHFRRAERPTQLTLLTRPHTRILQIKTIFTAISQAKQSVVETTQKLHFRLQFHAEFFPHCLLGQTQQTIDIVRLGFAEVKNEVGMFYADLSLANSPAF